MKKLFAILLALCLLCALLGCHDGKLGAEPNSSPGPEHIEEQEDVQYEAKPVIYLYPEETTQVEVKLDYDGRLAHTYPDYGDGWQVTAQPGGTLTDATGREYYCLFWEGESDWEYDFSQGFCVAGADTAAFLEDALARLGLTDQEAQEFIIYWLPKMEGNPYNLIAFQGEAYTDHARLAVTPEPDTLLRVFMAWKPVEAPVDLPAQELAAPERTGFTVVEWGGVELS